MKSLAISVLASIFLIGCGGTSSDGVSDYTDISVERGPVIGAYVVDNSGKRAISLGNGKYRFSKPPSYPITAYGGYIDVNRDGVIDANDTALKMALSLLEENKNVLTILTTLASNSDDIKNEILTNYGLSEDELYTLTPSNSLKVSAISDIVFKYCIENNISVSDINLSTLQSIKNDIDTLITSNESSSDELINIVTQNEINLVNELNITLENSDTNMTLVENTITQSSTQIQDTTLVLDSLGLFELTQEQIDNLIFMYQEEKVARDIYIKMYEKWGNKIFSNISKSEQNHMDAVKSILEKYSIEIPILGDEIGLFELDELQTLYNTLLISGNISSNEALKVGKLIEETDIADLLERLVDAPIDIELVYKNLLNGSYNHLNAFSKQIY